MAGSHAGHNAVVGDKVILVNGAALAGHTEVGSGVILSAHALIHQYCWIGDLVMCQGHSAASMHTPPYVILAIPINVVVGLNTVGLRRAEHISDEDRQQIKEAFKITYRSGLTPAAALQEMDTHKDWGQAVDKFRAFIRRVLNAKKPYDRGLCPVRQRD